MSKTTTLSPGARMPDGTVYAGVSPDTGKPMFATPKDAPLTLMFDQAAKHAAGLDEHGHKDWRVPTKAELNVLFQNRAAIGGFDAKWYWSSLRYRARYGAWAQRVRDGYQFCTNRYHGGALRCVRG